MRSSITLIVALLALVGCAAAFQLWPIGWTGDREDREQTRHRRGVSDVASEEGWTRGLDEWPEWGARDYAYSLDAARRSMLSPFNVKTTKSSYIVLLDVPGVPRKSINVTLLPPSNLLRVRGQIKCGTDDACISRTVSHDLSLPRDADLSKNVQVGVRDGVLRVTVPRRIEESGMGWKALDVVEDTWEAATDAAARATDAAASLVGKATDVAADAGSKATDAAANAAASATDAAAAATEAAKSMAGKAAENVGRAAGAAADTASKVVDRGEESAAKVVDQAQKAAGMGGKDERVVKPTEA